MTFCLPAAPRRDFPVGRPACRPPILAWLEKQQALAAQAGYAGVRILCEPTGAYERGLLGAARYCGCATALVHEEAASQTRVVRPHHVHFVPSSTGKVTTDIRVSRLRPDLLNYLLVAVPQID